MSSITNILSKLRESRINEDSHSYEYKFDIAWRENVSDEDGEIGNHYTTSTMDYADDIMEKAKKDFNESDLHVYAANDRRTEKYGIKSMTMDFDKDASCIVTVVTSVLLGQEGIDNVIDYLSGQMSDGWGEGFEQREIASFNEYDQEWVEDSDDEDGGYYEEVQHSYYVSGQFWWSDKSHPWYIELISTPHSEGMPTNETIEVTEEDRAYSKKASIEELRAELENIRSKMDNAVSSASEKKWMELYDLYKKELNSRKPTNESVGGLEESRTLWMGKYTPVNFNSRRSNWSGDGSPKKVVFYAGGDIHDAERELGDILPPYISCRVLGKAPSLQLCLDDGFELLNEPTNESAIPNDLDSQIIDEYMNGDSLSEIAANLGITIAEVKVVIDDWKANRKKMKESKSLKMEFPTEKEAEEYAKENGYKIDKIQTGKGDKACICWMSKLDEAKNSDYINVEYTYNGDDVSNYLGHVRVRTDKENVALYAAEKYAMSKHPEDEPRHFKITSDNYTNVDVVDDRGDYLTTMDESNDDSPKFKVGDVIEWSGLYGGQYTGKISKVTDNRVTVDVSWTSEDDGRLITKPSTYPIEKDSEGNECIIVWEYHGHKGYVYPPEMDMRESSDMKYIEDAPYSSSFMKDRGEVTINGESYVKIAKNKWEHHPKQSRAVGGTYSDKEIYDMMKESIKESKTTDSIIQELRIKIQSALHKFMTSPRCGFPEDEVKDYSRVEIELIDTDYGKAIKAEVRAELSFGALSDLCNELDPIIGYYEQGAYFEPEQPGIIVAYLAV